MSKDYERLYATGEAFIYAAIYGGRALRHRSRGIVRAYPGTEKVLERRIGDVLREALNVAQ